MMNMSTLIAVLILAALVFLAVRYIVVSKKSGKQCIGCPDAGSCCKAKDAAASRTENEKDCCR